MTQATSSRVSLVFVVGLGVLTATCLSTPMEAQVRSARRAATPAPAARAAAPAARAATPATRGAAVQTEDGYAAAGRRGAVVAGDEGYAAVGRHGAVVAGEDGYARAGHHGAVVAGEEGVAVAGRGGVVVGNRYESYEAWRAVAGVGTAIAVGTMLARPPAAATVVAYGGSSYYYDSGTYLHDRHFQRRPGLPGRVAAGRHRHRHAARGLQRHQPRWRRLLAVRLDLLPTRVERLSRRRALNRRIHPGGTDEGNCGVESQAASRELRLEPGATRGGRRPLRPHRAAGRAERRVDRTRTARARRGAQRHGRRSGATESRHVALKARVAR